jgi:hypothetical protein
VRPGEATDSASRSRWDLAILVAACALGAALRFIGIDHGLRHLPHSDEQVFVENVVSMVAAGDWDHRFYTYPGLFFYFLRLGIVWLGPTRWHGSDAYLLARMMVAAVGTVNIAVAFFVGRRLVGRWAGLAAAVLLAVSPVSVETAHWVRPDVLLQGLGLVAALALTRIGASLRNDLGVGAAIGVAAAMKFTGLLFAPSYIVARWLAAGRRRWLALCAAGATALLVVVATTPSSVLHMSEYREGPVRQIQQYYPTPAGKIAFGEHLVYFIRATVKDLGLPISVLFVAGAVMLLRSAARQWGPLLLHPLVVHVVMATGSLVFERYVLPSSGVVYLVACVPLARLASRAPRLAVVAFAFAVAFPLNASLRSSLYFAQPSAEDRALDWINEHVPAGARILETRGAAERGATAGAVIGLDRQRYERLFFPRGYGVDRLALLVPHFDYVITGRGRGGRWGASLETVFIGRRPHGQIALLIKAPRPEARPQYRLLDHRHMSVRVSTGNAGVSALLDGDPDTTWSSGRGLTTVDWLEITFDQAVPVGRVELWLGPGSAAPRLGLSGSADGSHYERAESVPARPQWTEEQLKPHSYVLLLYPKSVRGLRLVPRAPTDTPCILTGVDVSLRDPLPLTAIQTPTEGPEDADE